MTILEITRPDDWHTHLRDGEMLPHTVAHQARCFGRAIVMPNLVPPVTSVALARAYRDQIVAVTPADSGFEPLMTLYLTDATTADTVEEAKSSGLVHAFKLYPANATTHSAAGVSDIDALVPVFETMAACDLPLLIHGEVTDPDIDIFDREAAFIDRHLKPLMNRLPDLRIVLEHITTREAVDFVREAGERLGATLTAHHLLYDRNDMLAGGMRSLYYCLPILKRGSHREALLEAAISGHRRFFLGTDSAPHPRTAKENCWGCAAGCFTANCALELYAEAFDSAGAIDRLEGFASHYGADFYRLPRNRDSIRLVRKAWEVPRSLPGGRDELLPVAGGQTLSWCIETDHPAISSQASGIRS